MTLQPPTALPPPSSTSIQNARNKQSAWRLGPRCLSSSTPMNLPSSVIEMAWLKSITGMIWGFTFCIWAQPGPGTVLSQRTSVTVKLRPTIVISFVLQRFYFQDSLDLDIFHLRPVMICTLWLPPTSVTGSSSDPHDVLEECVFGRNYISLRHPIWSSSARV